MPSLRALLCVGLLLASGASADVIDGEELRDPTQPLFQSVVGGTESTVVPATNLAAGQYEVTFVRVSTTPVAIINRQRVTVGDVVGGATVIAIERGGVTLSVNEEERWIPVYGTNVTAPVLAQ